MQDLLNSMTPAGSGKHPVPQLIAKTVEPTAKMAAMASAADDDVALGRAHQQHLRGQAGRR